MPPRPVSRDEWDRRARAVGIEWTGDEPIDSQVKHPARCLHCGNDYEAWPRAVQKGHGCRVCAGKARRIDRAEWDRRASRAGIAWVGDKGIVSYRKHDARCLGCGHEWAVLPKDVARGHGCPACQCLSRDEWDRRAKEAGIEWIGDDPMVATTKHAARCLTCDYQWSPRPADIPRSGCPACVGLARITQEEWRERASGVGIEWIGDDPVRASFPHEARCLQCGHEYAALPSYIARSGGACPVCTPGGFDPAEPAIVYLLRIERGPLLKVGVANGDGSRRLGIHRSRGWESVGIWPVPTGRDALKIEQTVIAAWVAAGARMAAADDVPKRDGWTESVWIGLGAQEGETIALIRDALARVGA